ncbi:MAG: hypothetical protein QXF06_01220 [Archaeoglobaceae archaeon]
MLIIRSSTSMLSLCNLYSSSALIPEVAEIRMAVVKLSFWLKQFYEAPNSCISI